MPRSVIVGPDGEHIFSFCEKQENYFSEWLYTILHAQPQCVRDPVSLYSQKHLVLSLFFFILAPLISVLIDHHDLNLHCPES